MMDPSSLKEKIRNDPKALETFLEELLKDPSERTVDLLKELKELYKDHKECLKVVKRAIFKLRQKGVIFEEEGKSVSILRSIKLPEPKGYLGLWDLSGRLFLALEKETPRGLIGLSGFGSFEEGLLDFFGGSVAKKNWRKFLENQVVSSIKPKEVPASYVKTLFEELEGIRSHEEFRKQASYLESLPSYEGLVPLVFQYLSLEGLNNPKEEKLFEILPHFGLWAFKEEELKPYMEELRRAQESPLVLTQTQKSQRIDAIVEKAIQGLFTEKRRQALRRNLQEVALILWLNDKKEEAENLLLLAERLKEEPSPLRPDPFLRRLFLLGLQALSSEKAPREPSSF